jgi:hypothetical protein
MKIAVIGSREFDNPTFLSEVLGKYAVDISMLISGGCIGADKMAEQWARDKNIPIQIFKPEWTKYGKSAGIIRNRTIIENCDLCIAFWDGKSKGTASGIRICKEMKKECKVFYAY